MKSIDGDCQKKSDFTVNFSCFRNQDQNNLLVRPGDWRPGATPCESLRLMATERRGHEHVVYIRREALITGVFRIYLYMVLPCHAHTYM
jgi:hypothetical protein